MENFSLQSLANLIILIGAVLLAVERIYHSFKKPVDTLKTKNEQAVTKIVDKRLEEKLPEMLQECHASMREETQAEHQELFNQITKFFDEKSTPYFEEIERINLEQNEKISILMGSNRDLLRQHIINVYERNKHRHALSITEREFLNECFKDYSKANGNGYIEKIYHRMDD